MRPLLDRFQKVLPEANSVGMSRSSAGSQTHWKINLELFYVSESEGSDDALLAVEVHPDHVSPSLGIRPESHLHQQLPHSRMHETC